MSEPLRIAQLPMYDWPEIHEANNQLWQCIYNELQVRDIDAPRTLDRSSPPEDVWRSQTLLISQTCGLPLVTDLEGKVTVLGSFSYEGIAPVGSYHSVIVARRDAEESLAEYAGHRVAVNSEDSYSGCLALKCMINQLKPGGRFFAEMKISGAHRNSARMVATGDAELAALDCVSWDLAQRYEPLAADLKVIAKTPPRPNLPLVTAKSASEEAVTKMREALAAAAQKLSEEVRAKTKIIGFLPRGRADYDLIHDDFARCGNLLLAD